MTRFIFVLLILVLYFPMAGWACVLQPADQVVSIDQLIERTENIMLAKVVEAEAIEHENNITGKMDRDIDHYLEASGATVRYSFEIVETIKGEIEKSFILDGYKLIDNGDFNAHNDEVFWNAATGRLFGQPDCKIHPGFAVGNDYLIFLDKPYHHKSFELILNNQKDNWLYYVKDKVNE